MLTNGSRKKLAYIITLANSTFILREMLELNRQGVDLYVFALKEKPAGLEKQHPDLNRLPHPVVYSPYFLSAPLLCAQLYFIFTSPLKYFAALIQTLCESKSLSFKFKSLAVFPKSVYYARIIKKNNISHIHAHWATVSTTSARIISQILGIEFSFTGHAWDLFVDTDALKQKMRQAKQIVTCTQHNKVYLTNLCKDIDPGKINVNYHGLELDSYTPLPDKKNARFKILSVGNMVEKKGFPFLLKALHILRETGLDFEVDIFGHDGPQKEEILHLHKEYKLDDVVKINGYISHDAMIERMKQADIFVLPCIIYENSGIDQDGLPNVFIESLALQVPVISTPISGIPELVINMETGILVPPKDADALAQAIKYLYSDPQLRKKLGKNGREKVLEKFDIRKNVTELAQIIFS